MIMEDIQLTYLGLHRLSLFFFFFLGQSPFGSSLEHIWTHFIVVLVGGGGFAFAFSLPRNLDSLTFVFLLTSK